MKSKLLRITIDLILITLGIIFLVFGIKDVINTFTIRELDDNVKFSKSYTNVPTDNNFKYIESLDKLDKQKTIIFVGSPNDVWSQVISPVLYEIVKDKYDVIYYYEMTEDIPEIIIINENDKTVYKKGDLINSDYQGIPIEYFNQEKRLELSSKLLND